MLSELGRLAGLLVLGLLIVAALRVLVELIRNGERQIRDVREDGGGIKQKLLGELDGGQRHSSATRAHGVHMSVGAGGLLKVREKSVIARHPA